MKKTGVKLRIKIRVKKALNYYETWENNKKKKSKVRV